MPDKMRMGLLFVILSEVEESHFVIPNLSHRLLAETLRDFSTSLEMTNVSCSQILRACP
jgi:hypothetical protein